MKARIPLIPGAQYFAGYSRPFFIPQSMVRSHLEGLGASQIEFHDRDALPASVNPKTDPSYSDDWEEWVSMSYNGPRTTAEQSNLWAWAVRHTAVKPAKAQQGKLLPEPDFEIEHAATAVLPLVCLELVIAAYIVSRLKRR